MGCYITGGMGDIQEGGEYIQASKQGKWNYWIYQANEVEIEERSLWLRDDSIKRETVSFVFA